MATEKGVIQGYTGVAAVDGEYQIIVAARAHGTGFVVQNGARRWLLRSVQSR